MSIQAPTNEQIRKLLMFSESLKINGIRIHPMDHDWFDRGDLRGIAEDREPEVSWGSIGEASVVICTLNPSHSPDFENDDVREAFNQHMREMRRPNHTMAATESFYQKKAPASARAYHERTHGSFKYHERILNLRLCGYPSTSKSDLPAEIIRAGSGAPSVRAARKFVHNVLKPLAIRGELGLIILRSAAEWGFPSTDTDMEENGLLVRSRKVRNNSICGPQLRGFVSRFLGKKPLKHHIPNLTD